MFGELHSNSMNWVFFKEKFDALALTLPLFLIFIISKLLDLVYTVCLMLSLDWATLVQLRPNWFKPFENGSNLSNLYKTFPI